MTFKKILAALDHSIQTPLVFEKALEQAKQCGGALFLVHSVRRETDVQTGPFLGIGTIADIDTYNTLRRVQQEHLQREVDKANNWLRDYWQQAIAQEVTTEFECRVGEPSIEVCNAVRNWGADLVVIGRRGHHGLTEVVLGSVSNYVVHRAPCSVLVVQGLLPTIKESAATTTHTETKV
jgi:nucleotide-binding universal stress UspA family protein